MKSSREAVQEVENLDALGPNEDDESSQPRPLASRAAHQVAFQKAAEAIPGKFRGVYLRSAQGEASPRTAIKAKCQECTGYEEMAQRIGQCTAYKCPLWAYRPFQTEGEIE